jgi:hypothetical protein
MPYHYRCLKIQQPRLLLATSVAVAGAKVASIDAALLVASKLIKLGATLARFGGVYRAVYASAPTPFPIRAARLHQLILGNIQASKVL